MENYRMYNPRNRKHLYFERDVLLRLNNMTNAQYEYFVEFMFSKFQMRIEKGFDCFDRFQREIFENDVVLYNNAYYLITRCLKTHRMIMGFFGYNVVDTRLIYFEEEVEIVGNIHTLENLVGLQRNAR